MLTPQILPSNETPLYVSPVGVPTVFSKVGRWFSPAQKRRDDIEMLEEEEEEGIFF